jgi:hypothetical protein
MRGRFNESLPRSSDSWKRPLTEPSPGYLQWVPPSPRTRGEERCGARRDVPLRYAAAVSGSQ